MPKSSGQVPRERQLLIDFAAYCGEGQTISRYFDSDSLIVTDTNILLDLYRYSSGARKQVLDIFDRISNQMWIPHQVAIEFGRNRRNAVLDRIELFKSTKQALRNAEDSAVKAVGDSVSRLLKLREATGVQSKWNLDAVGLDDASIRTRLTGIVDPALTELDALQAEQDLDIKSLNEDPVLLELNRIFMGRVGCAYPMQKMRMLVDEAHEFRFPNEIPPGFRDSSKGTRLRAAGDFILWRQILDKAIERNTPDLPVLIITRDSKPDWWATDDKNRPIGALPGLTQELRDEAGADLRLLTMKGFLENASLHLHSSISAETLSEAAQVDEAERIKEAVHRISGYEQHRTPSTKFFQMLSHDLIYVATALFTAMGCEVLGRRDEGTSPHVDILLRSNNETWGVELKNYSMPLGSSDIRKTLDTLERSNVDRKVLVTLGPLTFSAMELAEDSQLRVIDRDDLAELLAQHLEGH